MRQSMGIIAGQQCVNVINSSDKIIKKKALICSKNYALISCKFESFSIQTIIQQFSVTTLSIIQGNNGIGNLKKNPEHKLLLYDK